jgi:hypothetical protein
MSKSKTGSIKGQPNKYISGHARGVYRSLQTPTPKDYYVYMYLRSRISDGDLAGTPYYVGKGTRRRAWSNVARYIPRPKEDRYIEIVSSGMTEDDAFELEKKLISIYGRIDIGTGILRNMTDGGEGPSKCSDEYRKQCADRQRERWKDEDFRARVIKSLKGKNSGKIRSKETRDKLSKSHKGKTRGPMPEETKRKLSESAKNRSYKKGGTHTGRAKGEHIVKHGTLWEYRCGCRCEECRGCNAESCRKSKLKKNMLT